MLVVSSGWSSPTQLFMATLRAPRAFGGHYCSYNSLRRTFRRGRRTGTLYWQQNMRRGLRSWTQQLAVQAGVDAMLLAYFNARRQIHRSRLGAPGVMLCVKAGIAM